VHGILDYRNCVTGARNITFSLWDIRTLLGVGEAGNWPAAIKLASEWFPPEERSTAIGQYLTAAPPSVQ